jgi:hypothetical protein
VKIGTQSGLMGFDRSLILACAGVLSLLRALQSLHAVTMFSHLVMPPCALGTTWS